MSTNSVPEGIIGICFKLMRRGGFRLSDDTACKLLVAVQGLCSGCISAIDATSTRDKLRELMGMFKNLMPHCNEVGRLALLDVSGRCIMLSGDLQAAANMLIRRAVVPSDGGVPGSRRDCLLFAVSCSLANLWKRAPPRMLSAPTGLLTWDELSPLDPTDPLVQHVLCFGGMLVGLAGYETHAQPLMLGIAEVQARSGKLAAALKCAEAVLRLQTERAVSVTPGQMQHDRVAVLAMCLINARVHRKMGQLDKACACFTEVLQYTDDPVVVMMASIEKAACLLEAGKWADALQLIVCASNGTRIVLQVDRTEPHSACWALVGAPWHASPGHGPSDMALHCDISFLRLVGYAEKRSCVGMLAELRRLLPTDDLDPHVHELLAADGAADVHRRCASIVAHAHLWRALHRCHERRFVEAAEAAEMAVVMPMLERSHMWHCALAVRAWCALLAGQADPDDPDDGDDSGPACLVRYARVCRLLIDCRSDEALALLKRGVQFSPSSRSSGDSVQCILDCIRQRCGATATQEDLLVCCMINSVDADGALSLLKASGNPWDRKTRGSTLHALNYARVTSAMGDVRSAAMNLFEAWEQAGACVAGELWVRTYLKDERGRSRAATLKLLMGLADCSLRTVKMLHIRDKIRFLKVRWRGVCVLQTTNVTN